MSDTVLTQHKESALMPVPPVAGEELLSILPHKGKMFLISRILDYSVQGRTLRSEYDVTEDCLFYDPFVGGVPSWVSFEFMAQAVSALSGLTGRFLGKPPLMGFILSVLSLETRTPLFRTGSVIQVRIAEEVKMDSVSTFRCRTDLDGAAVAEAKLTVMDVEDPSVYIERTDYGKR
ncbi:MAG: 3-hydroxylacyl-ACP dehydratase [Treponema sp.]|jgi:predicted hotdog family 3-hydroxylacyl-ACP dehydratase|nr:3-hydroxylacyl-ACP dehydratase [Treponema sp.]